MINQYILINIIYLSTNDLALIVGRPKNDKKAQVEGTNLDETNTLP